MLICLQRWIFWINLPFCVIGFVMVPWFLRLSRRPGDLVEQLRQVNFFDSALFVAGLTSLLIPLTWGGVMYPWSSWRTVLPMFMGVLGLGFFCFRSVHNPNALIRGSLFKSSTAVVTYLGTVLQGTIVRISTSFSPCCGFQIGADAV